MTTLLFTACSNDDEDSSSETNNTFVGLWDYNKTKILFFNDGKVSYGSSLGSWSYSKSTGILATTISVNNTALQWEITIVSDDEWAGICLHDNNKSTASANRNNNAKDLASVVLSLSEWKSSNEETLKASLDAKSGLSDISNAKISGRYYINNVEYDKSRDVLKINYWNNPDYIEISHPFNYTKSRLFIHFEDISKGTYEQSFSRVK